jgi:ligand-binding SRPBCC domain-containing protein
MITPRIASVPTGFAADAASPAGLYLRERPPLRRLSQETRLAAPLDEVFPFFSDAGNLELLTPGWLRFRILTAQPIEMRAGAVLDYRIVLGLLPTSWRTRIELWEPPHRFVDAQLSGPYRCWWHEHRFEPTPGGTLMTDEVLFTPALGRLGQLVAGPAVEGRLRSIFSHRARVIGSLFGSIPVTVA